MRIEDVVVIPSFISEIGGYNELPMRSIQQQIVMDSSSSTKALIIIDAYLRNINATHI